VLPGAIAVPQYDFKPVVVDVQLIGQQLTVVVDGKQVYDGTPTATGVDGGTSQLLSQPGRVGFGVFYDGQVTFDDLLVEVLK
jgi:archaellum component FlaG (FlaF/FlaG flagellin family)